MCVQRTVFKISQDNAAADLRWGGRFYSSLFCSSSQNAIQSLHVWQS